MEEVGELVGPANATERKSASLSDLQTQLVEEVGELVEPADKWSDLSTVHREEDSQFSVKEHTSMTKLASTLPLVALVPMLE